VTCNMISMNQRVTNSVFQNFHWNSYKNSWDTTPSKPELVGGFCSQVLVIALQC